LSINFAKARPLVQVSTVKFSCSLSLSNKPTNQPLKMMFNPHKMGLHKILQHIPLNAIFDAPYKRRLAKAVNIADLRLIAKSRAHKVSQTAGELTPESATG